MAPAQHLYGEAQFDAKQAAHLPTSAGSQLYPTTKHLRVQEFNFPPFVPEVRFGT